jgi:hypothetical protein
MNKCVDQSIIMRHQVQDDLVRKLKAAFPNACSEAEYQAMAESMYQYNLYCCGPTKSEIRWNIVFSVNSESPSLMSRNESMTQV